ncbi:MAG: hypothetical protein DI587_17000 [Variovorax paradoxus]|nr:MAG: hypothetical protein DI583_17000 [Variovorax paradoxus]PZQ08933.1 MAG: hypothetical protein DI587_17000 [Variovorax paradoxus]
MAWHLEVTSITARRYLPGHSAEARDQFASVAYIQVMDLGQKTYVSAFLNDGSKGSISPSEMLELKEALAALGVKVASSSRRGKDKDYQTGPAPLT